MKTKPQNQAFGIQLREYRDLTGLDQKQLAEAVQVTLDHWQQTGEFVHDKKMNREDISNWENNRRLPSRPGLVKALAYTLASELSKVGYQFSADMIFRYLMYGTEDQIPVGYVSDRAAALDGLMRFFPDTEADFEWDVIYMFVKARIDRKAQLEHDAHMTNLRR